jgi:hypothetical protein
MDLFRLRTRNRTLVANRQIIPNPTLSLLGQYFSNLVRRNPGIRCFTSTGSLIEFQWHFSQLSFQTSCSFTHIQLAAYSDVSVAPISERIPGKMLKHGAFLLTIELATTPTCKQSIRQSMLMLEHYTWHFFRYENNAFDFLFHIVFHAPFGFVLYLSSPKRVSWWNKFEKRSYRLLRTGARVHLAVRDVSIR